jgi:hypothetical protein
MLMPKLLIQVRRKPGLSDSVFYDRWRQEHGALVRANAAAMGFLRYTQAHRIPSAEIAEFAAGRGWREAPDGQAELWWDSIDAMSSALASPEGQAADALLTVDEEAFTETQALSAFFAVPETIFDLTDGLTHEAASPPVKMVVEVWKRAEMSHTEFSERWRGAHGDLVREHAGAMGFTRYVQNHRDHSVQLDFGEARGWLAPPDGITEVWWENEASLKQSFASPEAAASSAILALDEAKFIEPARISGFLAVDHSIFDFTGG